MSAELLGVDLGECRVRVALGKKTDDGVRVQGVSARDVPDGTIVNGEVRDCGILAAIVEDAVHELRPRTKRCVSAVAAPWATLRIAQFPPMSAFERQRAARLDAERRAGANAGPLVVRIHPWDAARHLYAVGTVPVPVLRSRLNMLRAAQLRPVRIDFEGLALARSYGEVDAIVDVAQHRTVLHHYGRAEALTMWCAAGGATVTNGIRYDLAIDERTAESRKRVIGTNGAGERAVGELAREIAELIGGARRRKIRIDRVAFAGNGSRVQVLRDAVERLAHVVVWPARPIPLCAERFPEDVARAACADWALAVGLASA